MAAATQRSGMNGIQIFLELCQDAALWLYEERQIELDILSWWSERHAEIVSTMKYLQIF